ncbi:MAG: gliding motility-associated C-terminal domain-containing protein, partial [Bacteroidota bacterium]
TEYYLFTVDAAGGANGLQYSVIDMTADNGLGAVVQKNVPIVAPVCEKVTAVAHATDDAFWLISHRWQSDEYLVYRVDASGVSSTPGVYASGVPHDGPVRNAQGYLKASPDGTRLAAAVNLDGFVEVLAFDDATGQISPIDNSPFCCEIEGIVRAFGVEFSPDSRLLYFTSDAFTPSARESYVYQTRVDGNFWPDINNQTQIVHTQTYGLFEPDVLQGALQLGPDERIYGAWLDAPYLSAINSPNVLGSGCNYELEAVDLSPRRSGLGLPAFVQSFVAPPEVDFSFPTEICAGESILFEGRANPEPDAWSWVFGNGQTANTPDASTSFDGGGLFPVTLTVTRGGESNSITKLVEITPVPVDPFDGPVVGCFGEPITLDAQNPGFTYVWSEGGLGLQQIEVFNPGAYSVTISSEGDCERSCEVEVEVVRRPQIELPEDTVVCSADSFRLANTGENLQPIWSTGDTANAITVDTTGWYRVTDTRDGCSRTDSIFVQFSQPVSAFGLADTGVCFPAGDALLLAPQGPTWFQWLSLPDSNRALQVSSLGVYQLAYRDSLGCTDTTAIEVFPDCYRLPAPTAFSPNGDGLNDRFTLPTYGLDDIELSIFNRWGERLWQGDPRQQGWDGGSAPEGVYVWQLEATIDTPSVQRRISRSGTLTLIR